MTLTTGTDQTIDREVLLRIFETVVPDPGLRRQGAGADRQRRRPSSCTTRSGVTRSSRPPSARPSSPTDYMTATYRGIGDEIAKGVPLRELWAEMLGKATGTSKGRGGPMHIADPEHGLMLCTGIVGGGMPIADRARPGLAAPGRRPGHDLQLR